MPSITRASALGSACALALGTQAGMQLAAAAPKFDAADLKALGVALALERSVIRTYSDPAVTKLLAPPVLAVLDQFLADHTAHRDALVQAIAATGQAAGEDVADVTVPTLASEADVLGFAYTLEKSLATTHLASISALHNRDYAQTAASILGVETTHVALLGEALRQGRAYPTGFVAP